MVTWADLPLVLGSLPADDDSRDMTSRDLPDRPLTEVVQQAIKQAIHNGQPVEPLARPLTLTARPD